MQEFSHFNEKGDAVMVDIGNKSDTERIAVAVGVISMSSECYEKISEGSMAKGDVLGVARIAGIMGLKKTSELIPLCHQIPITNAGIDFEMLEGNRIRAVCEVKTTYKTGVEMEALTGVMTALLTIYDMCKAVDKKMEILDVHLCSKSGGKSGDFNRSLQE